MTAAASLLSLSFCAQVVRISVPYVLAALGGTMSERSGVVNIGLEGLLLGGAFASTAVALLCGDAAGPAAGLLAGVLAGLALAALHALCVLRFRADAVISGVAVTLLASGGSRFLLKALYDSASNSPRIGGLAEAGPWAGGGGISDFVGETLGSPLVMAALGATLLGHALLFRTPFGLRLRAAGENPEALVALGVSVSRLRWAGVLLSGALGGLGGVWLAYDQHKFVAGMAAGRGYIALAAVILGGWRPLRVATACLLFGLAEAVGLRLSSGAVGAGGALVQALPYLVTLVVVALRASSQRPPRALGRPL